MCDAYVTLSSAVEQTFNGTSEENVERSGSNLNFQTYLEHDQLWNLVELFLWIQVRAPSVAYHLQHFLHYFSNTRLLSLLNTVDKHIVEGESKALNQKLFRCV